MSEHPPSPDLIVSALRAMGVAVLSRSAEGEDFRMMAPEPDWWEPVFHSAGTFRERSFFLDDFVQGPAADFWRGVSGDGSQALSSGIWEETSEGGGSRFFEAIASRSDGGEALLMVTPADERWHREWAFTQNAHEQSLNRRRLRKELEKKQVLLECIMHDLGNPVATVMMNLQHLGRQLGEAESALRPAVRRALAQAERQRLLIRSIAEVFAADLAGSRELVDGEPPDLVEVAAETIAACAPAAMDAGVTLCPFFCEPLRVHGDRLALSRVMENLIVNAIRHTPRGGRVTLAFDHTDDLATCRIEDDGPGIEHGMEDRLFRPFAQGERHPGQSGLGLYFCRLTVGMWGGTISGTNREQGTGAVFAFSLPRYRADGEKKGGGHE